MAYGWWFDHSLHPDKSSGGASATEDEDFTYNGLGEVVTSEDRNGSVHTLTRDVVGRLVSDAVTTLGSGVTTLGSGVDGTVRRIETAYDSAGLPYLFTQYSASSGGTS